MPTPQLRLAELMASFSLAIDLGSGQPMEWVIRCTLLGARLAEALNLNEDERRDIFYLSLLRHIGCTANAHSDAQLFGNEMVGAAAMTIDADDTQAVIRYVTSVIGKDTLGNNRPWLARAAMFARVLAAGPNLAKANHTAQCEVGQHLAAALGFEPRLQQALLHVYERWDGKGDVTQLKGQQIPLAVRVTHVAQDAAAFFQLGGLDMAVEIARNRAGRQFDPDIVETFCKHASALCSGLDAPSSWEAVLAAEPGAPLILTDEQLDSAAYAIADFTDLKSPFMLSHSRHVAGLAEAAARRCRLPDTDVAAIRRAGLIHDIGRVGVTSGIWGKAGPLTEAEWERVRLHSYYTERIFTRAASLAPLSALAAQHHERLDGSGYHRRLPGASLTLMARLLAAADMYSAMTEPRPHRAALPPERAAEDRKSVVKAGKFDSQAVDEVLSAAGHTVGKRHGMATSLSEREIE